MSGLELLGVSHHYGDLLAVDVVSLTVTPGEVVCLLGPSGCGKTTLLRIAAGLEPLQAGRVLIDGQAVADERGELPPERRRIGFVFQDYALFPHLSVLDNVSFGLHGLARAERRTRGLAALERVGLADRADDYPHTLSGGQQQRVALARALAPQPRVMLLDEPFAGLDRRLREQVREDTLRVLQASEAAVLLVTHDPEEAMAMGDRVGIMRAGRIEQVGTPAEVYRRPSNPFVARFLGETNRFTGRVRGGTVATPLGPVPAAGQPDDQPVEVLVRPEAIHVEPAADGSGTPGRPATVLDARLLGATTVIRLSVAAAGGQAQLVRALRLGCDAPARGLTVRATLDPALAFIFPLGNSFEVPRGPV